MDEFLIIALLVPVYAFIFVCLASWFFGRAKRFILRDVFVAMTVVALLLGIILALKPSVQ
jgi:hypothetical protein